MNKYDMFRDYVETVASEPVTEQDIIDFIDGFENFYEETYENDR